MSVLHIVSRSGPDDSPLARCLACLNRDDGLLLIDSGVHAAVHGGDQTAQLLDLPSSVAVCVLRPSLVEAGLSEQALIERVVLVDFAGFVDLTAAFETSVTWF